ncbi:M18 family aminopeptidase [Actinomycetaceae bacterium MB13-C1-2]|nr:M18 family aminopeptidase [Actinomycetaceae bacterium MB13-C1-2]
MSDTTELFASNYLDYLSKSPSPYHAVETAASILESAGFIRTFRTDAWPEEAGKYFFVEQGALFAWITPGSQAVSGTAPSFAIVGTHSDSPSLKLKPTPQRTSPDGWGQLMVEIYGGPLFNSWLDRELLLAGQIIDRDGNTHLVQTEPIARVSQLAPHLDRSVNVEGVKLDAQQHMQPVWTVDDPEAQILDLVATTAGLDSQEAISAFDLFLYPSQPGERFGSKRQFIAAARQDNLSSTFAGLDAFAGLDTSELANPARVPAFVIFDHEEVGSATATGARGPLLRSSLRRIATSLGLGEEQFEQMLARSSVISADASHSVHPAYPAKHDPDTRPMMGRGPILKVDADQSYATSAPGSAMWESVCERAGFTSQHFVSESSMRSGSTIGPAISIALGITTVDVGIPLLSMHSAREMSHVNDTPLLSKALSVYWLS